MEKDKKEKQKKVFLLSLVFIILLFGTFVIAAVKFVNSDNNKDKISTKTPITSTASISKEKVESYTIESSTISISTESAKDNKEEKVAKSDKKDKKTVEQNTNEGKEEVNTEKQTSQQSSSKEDASLNNSSNISNNNSSNNGSSSEENNNEETKKEEEKSKFIVNINIKMVDNTLLSSQIVLDNEVNAFEALKYYCESNSIQLGYTGSGKFAYVNSISGIKEKSEGPSSGWMYKVNGTFPNISAGRYDLSSNDTLEWVFTKDGGKDVGER